MKIHAQICFTHLRELKPGINYTLCLKLNKTNPRTLGITSWKTNLMQSSPETLLQTFNRNYTFHMLHFTNCYYKLHHEQRGKLKQVSSEGGRNHPKEGRLI